MSKELFRSILKNLTEAEVYELVQNPLLGIPIGKAIIEVFLSHKQESELLGKEMVPPTFYLHNPDYKERLKIVPYKNLSGHYKKLLIADGAWQIREEYVKRHKLFDTTLLRFAMDSDERVREAVIKHQRKLSVEVLRILAKDSNEFIASTAIGKLLVEHNEHLGAPAPQVDTSKPALKPREHIPDVHEETGIDFGWVREEWKPALRPHIIHWATSSGELSLKLWRDSLILRNFPTMNVYEFREKILKNPTEELILNNQREFTAKRTLLLPENLRRYVKQYEIRDTLDDARKIHWDEMWRLVDSRDSNTLAIDQNKSAKPSVKSWEEDNEEE